jgi:hypothetical protein
MMARSTGRQGSIQNPPAEQYSPSGVSVTIDAPGVEVAATRHASRSKIASERVWNRTSLCQDLAFDTMLVRIYTALADTSQDMKAIGAVETREGGSVYGRWAVG